MFWIMTALMAALAGLLVLAGARRGVDGGEVVTAATASAELSELDRLKARGLLDEAGWTAARAEAGRRILSARRETAPVVAGARDRFWVLGGLGGAVAVAVGLYVLLGAPGLPDQSWERRVDAWATQLDSLEPAQISAVVARVVDERPNDHQALTMLGAARFEAGDPIGAASAFRRAVAVRPDDAQSWARLGESLVRANQGEVDGDAEAAFRQAPRLRRFGQPAHEAAPAADRRVCRSARRGSAGSRAAISGSHISRTRAVSPRASAASPRK